MKDLESCEYCKENINLLMAITSSLQEQMDSLKEQICQLEAEKMQLILNNNNNNNKEMY